MVVHRLCASHPGVQADSVLVSAELPVIRRLHGEVLRGILDVAAQDVLPFNVFIGPLSARLHAYVHEHDGGSQGHYGNVVVIPSKLHGLVRGRTSGIIRGAAVGVFRTLVEGAANVEFVPVTLESGNEDVVGVSGHVPVVGADYAFVVIAEGLPPKFCEKAEGGVEPDPGLLDVEGAFVGLTPHAGVLHGRFHL